MIKWCNKHGETEHSKNGRCKKCAVEAVQKRRDKVKVMAVDYKGGKCEKCGYDKCIDALEFHHLDPNEKDFGIASKGYTRSWEVVKQEIDKCILICANCHREIHATEKLYIMEDLIQERQDQKDKEETLKQIELNKEANKPKRPNREELKNLIRSETFVYVGKLYGVRDNSVRKWCKKFNLPHRKTDIMKMSDEEWLAI